MSMGTVSDGSSNQYYTGPSIAPKPQDSPEMTPVGDEGKSVAADLSQSTIGVGGSGSVHIQSQLQQSAHPMLVPPINAGTGKEGAKYPLNQDPNTPISDSASQETILAYFDGSYDNFTGTVNKFQKEILERALNDLPEDIKLILKIAMDDPDGSQEMEEGSYSGLYGPGGLKGDKEIQEEEALNNAKDDFRVMDASKKTEFRNAANYLAVIAKVLALVSLIKGMMSNSEATITKEQQLRDIQDLKASLDVAKQEIKKREEMREKLKEAQGGFLSFLPDSVKIALGAALLTLAVLTAGLGLLLLPLGAPFLVIALGIGATGLALTCDGAGASLEREIGKMACSIFGGDQTDAEWVGYITCGILFGGVLNPYTYYAIGEGVAAKNKADYEKEKDELQADQMTAGAQIDTLKDQANRKMATIQNANKEMLGGDKVTSDDMISFMAALMALMTILMMMMALMHAKGAGGCPGKGGSKGPGKAGSTGAATQAGEGADSTGTGTTEATPMEGNGLGLTPFGTPAAPPSSMKPENEFPLGQDPLAGQAEPQAPLESPSVQPLAQPLATPSAIDSSPLQTPDKELDFGTGGLFINGKPIPDFSVARENHPAISSQNNYNPGQFSLAGMWTPSESIDTEGKPIEKLLDNIDKELNKLKNFITRYKEDTEDKTKEDPQSILNAFQPFIAAVMKVMQPGLGVGDPNNNINTVIFKAVFEAISLLDPSYSDPAKQETLWQAMEATQVENDINRDSAWNSVEMSETEHQESVLKVTSTSA